MRPPLRRLWYPRIEVGSTTHKGVDVSMNTRKVVAGLMWLVVGCGQDETQIFQDWPLTEQVEPSPPLEPPAPPEPPLLLPRPACAPEGATVGAQLRARWDTFEEDTPLLVHATADWVPGQQRSPETEASALMMQEIEARGLRTLATPVSREQARLDPLRRYARPSNDTHFVGALVRVTPRALEAWLASSCAVSFVWLSGFDCQADPSGCEAAETCRFFHAGRVFDPDLGCLFPTVTGCASEAPMSCDFAVTERRDAYGFCWLFGDSCVPQGNTMPYDFACSRTIRESECASGLW